MRYYILLLASCAIATATPIPPSVPVVLRPKPLHSPSHTPTKDKKMVKAFTVAGGTENPVLPMSMEFIVVSNLFGRFLFTAGALQPANNALSFEVSPVLGDWVSLAYFGPVASDQQSFTSLYCNDETLYVRARLIPIPAVRGQSQTGWMPASLVPVVGTKIYLNPHKVGAKAWSVKK